MGNSAPLTPWNGEVGSEVFDANIEMILSYASGVPVVDNNGNPVYDSNGNPAWADQDHQYLSMKVECDQPFQVEQVIKGLALDIVGGVDPTFCTILPSYFSCLGLQGVYSGDQCSYVVENQHYTPVNSSQELTVSFGGTITLAPEPEFATRPAYRMTIDRFKL